LLAVVAVVAVVAVTADEAVPQKLPTKHDVEQITVPRIFPEAQTDVFVDTEFRLASEPDTITFFQLGIKIFLSLRLAIPLGTHFPYGPSIGINKYTDID
jgi:hypothetical protein